MNKSIYLLAVLFYLSYNMAYGQDSSEEINDDKGVFIGISLIGTSLQFDVPEFNDIENTGGGLGLEIGYNFNTNVAMFLSFDGSQISPDNGDEYTLAHVDLGVEGRLGDTESSFRPFGKVALLGAVAVQELEQGGDFEISGGGIGLGIGVYYFVNQNFALDLGYTHSWININEVSIGSISVEVDENAQSGRLGLGFSYHF